MYLFAHMSLFTKELSQIILLLLRKILACFILRTYSKSTWSTCFGCFWVLCSIWLSFVFFLNIIFGYIIQVTHVIRIYVLMCNFMFLFLAVADLLLWKKWFGGIVLLISATTVWFLFERAGYNLLSFVANVLLLLVIILFFWAKSATLLNRYLSIFYIFSSFSFFFPPNPAGVLSDLFKICSLQIENKFIDNNRSYN